LAVDVFNGGDRGWIRLVRPVQGKTPGYSIRRPEYTVGIV